MEEFNMANFDNHPSVSLEYVKFLAMNSGFELMETVQKEMAGLLKENKAVDKHRKAAEQATLIAGDTQKALDEVLKQMVALERKAK